MKYQNIGVDLGSRLLKISSLDYIEDLPNEFKILDLKSVKVPPDIDSIEDYFKFVQASIKDFVKENNLKHIRLNLTLPCDNDNLIANCIKLTKVEEKFLDNTILLEVEANIDFNRKDYIHKYKILEENHETNEILVLSTLLKRDFQEEVLKLRSLRWKVDQLEPQFYIGNKAFNKNSSLIDFGYSSTRIYLYKDGYIKDIDIIELGLETYLNKIGDIYETSLEESEEILKDSQVNNSFVGDINEQMAFNMNQDSLDLISELTLITKNITEELKRSIRVMELNNNIILEDFYYSGGISNMEYFTEFIEEDLEINLKPFNFLTMTEYSFDEYIDRLKENDFLNLRVKSDLEPNKAEDSFNLLPDQEDLSNQVNINPDIIDKVKAQYNKVEDFIYSSLANIKNDSVFNYLRDTRFYVDKTALLIGLVTATLFTHVGIWAINNNYDKKISIGDSYLTELNSKNNSLDSEIMDLNDNMDRNRTIINRVENLKDKKKWLSDILYVLPEGTPTNTGIVHASIEPGHAILKGYSEDYSGIGYLAMALEKYGEVTITEVGEKTDPGDFRVEGNVTMYKQFIIEIKHDHRLINDDNPYSAIGESLEDDVEKTTTEDGDTDLEEKDKQQES